MRKRPHKHYRRVKTRKGRRRVLVNKYVRKRKKRRAFRPGMKIPLLEDKTDWSGDSPKYQWRNKPIVWQVPPKKSIKGFKGIDLENLSDSKGRPVDFSKIPSAGHRAKVSGFREKARTTIFADAFTPTLPPDESQYRGEFPEDYGLKGDPLLDYDDQRPGHKLKITPFMERLPMREVRRKLRLRETILPSRGFRRNYGFYKPDFYMKLTRGPGHWYHHEEGPLAGQRSWITNQELSGTFRHLRNGKR